MHFPSLLLGLIMGVVAALGWSLLVSDAPDVPAAAPIKPLATEPLRRDASDLSVPPPSETSVVWRRELALSDERGTGSETEESTLQAAPSVLEWDPLGRYRELCREPDPSPFPWVQVAHGLAQIGAASTAEHRPDTFVMDDVAEACLDSWWQAYRRDPKRNEPRVFLAARPEAWKERISEELERFERSFLECEAMEADLLALFDTEGLWEEACEVLRIDVFVERLSRRGHPDARDLRRGPARWRALAACHPVTWEALLTGALGSTDRTTRRYALERLVPVWVEQGRTESLQELAEDPRIGDQHRYDLERLWPGARDAESRYRDNPNSVDTIVARFDELQELGDVAAAMGLMRQHASGTSLDSEELAKLVGRDPEGLTPILEARLQRALTQAAPSLDSDSHEPVQRLAGR